MSLSAAAQSNVVPSMPVPPLRTNLAQPPFPLVFPGGKSPVEFFRELLAMSAAERAQALTNRPAASRKQILAKVREYEAMKPNQRELRLKATELRYYLWPLMSVPAASREPLLARVPEGMTNLVRDRLAEWDKLAPEVQRQLLENEATLRYFTELAESTQEQKTNILGSLSPARREMLQRGIRQWQSLPEEQRQKTLARFNQFFELTQNEKNLTLQTISGAEQQQMEKTLRKFERLSPVQRALCMKSFEKFASLSLEERQQFLKNVDQWKRMSPDERENWRELVRKLNPPPPLPPGLERPPVPPQLQTLPRRVTKGNATVATNGS
jgi:hypothetical protein